MCQPRNPAMTGAMRLDRRGSAPRCVSPATPKLPQGVRSFVCAVLRAVWRSSCTSSKCASHSDVTRSIRKENTHEPEPRKACRPG